MAAKKIVGAPVSKKPVTPAKAVAAAPAVSSTPVRNSPVPKSAAPKAAAAKKEIGYGDIAQRAYEIYASGQGGSEQDNWFRAERELRGL
jgi:hypothetical protein